MRAARRVSDIKNDTSAARLSTAHKALINKVAVDRDREAFHALFLHFGPRVKAMMIRSGADYAQAEDLVQDVMMRVWRKVDLYSPERASVSTWIFTIARNARIDRLRRSSSRPYEDIDEIELAADQADAADEVFANQRAKRIATALLALPEEQRQVIELAYIQDLPQSEIAGKLKLPLGTVKSRMRLAYMKLKTELEDFT